MTPHPASRMRALQGGIETLPRRSYLQLVSTVLFLAVLAWLGIIAWARSSLSMNAMPGQVTASALALFAAMWLVMMAAMMLPAVSPVALLFRTVQRQRSAGGRPVVPVAAFVSGYLIVWTLTGLGADLAYAGAQAVGPHLVSGSNLERYLGGAILALAGLYQFTPAKFACLSHCRSPLSLIMHGWRDGRLGAVRMGATHGLFCLGCCSGIMAVLFVVGLMNLGWMAALSLLILVEKVVPRGVLIGQIVGGVFIVLGLVMALQPGLFPATGLTPAATMTMTGMPVAPAPAAGHVTYRTVAGPYALTLTIGPAETMLTPAEARRTHARMGEVMLDGATASAMPMGTMQRHLELRVAEGDMGMAVTNAHVLVSVQGAGAPKGSLMLARMYGVREGMKDLHYGINIGLDSGDYVVRMQVNGSTVSLHVRVP